MSSIELGESGGSSSTGDAIQTTVSASVSTSATTDPTPTNPDTTDDTNSVSTSETGSTDDANGWCLEEYGLPDLVPRSPHLADVDGDGAQELWDVDYDDDASTLNPFVIQIDGGVDVLASMTRTGRYRRFADIDGDGHDDAVFDDGEGSALRWFQGRSDARLGDEQLPLDFDPALLFTTTWHDANGDDIADILRFRTDAAMVELWIGDGLGGFALVQEAAAVGVGPFFGDAGFLPSNEPPFLPETMGFALRADNGAIGFGIESALAVVTIDTASTLQVTSATDYLPWQQPIGIGELDGQAPADLIGLVDSREIVFWHGEAKGGFTPQVLTSLDSEVRLATVGDFRGDGTRDIMVITAYGEVLLYSAPVSAGAVALEVSGTLDTALFYTTIDVDGDGRLELYGTRFDNGATYAKLVRIVEC